MGSKKQVCIFPFSYYWISGVLSIDISRNESYRDFFSNNTPESLPDETGSPMLQRGTNQYYEACYRGRSGDWRCVA